jgi:hypothetical protein
MYLDKCTYLLNKLQERYIMSRSETVCWVQLNIPSLSETVSTASYFERTKSKGCESFSFAMYKTTSGSFFKTYQELHFY